MIHLPKENGESACGRFNGHFDDMAVGAMQSDCDDCRAVFMIGPVAQKGCAVTEYPEYIAQPYPNAASMLDELQKLRDGR